MSLDDPRLALHQDRCTEIYKQAYLHRLAEEPDRFPDLEKKAYSMGGYEPTRTMDPMGLGIGGLAGAGAGAIGGMGANAMGAQLSPEDIAILMGGGGALGAGIGGFTQETPEDMEQDMVRRQAMMQAQQFADEYGAQMSGATI